VSSQDNATGRFGRQLRDVADGAVDDADTDDDSSSLL